MGRRPAAASPPAAQPPAAPEASSEAPDEADPNSGESRAPSPAAETRLTSSAEQGKRSREHHRIILHYALTHGDENGVYHDENLIRTITEAHDDITPEQVSTSLHSLKRMGVIATDKAEDGHVDMIAVHFLKVDQAIIARKLLLFSGEKTALQLMQSRRRELERSEDDLPAATGGSSSWPASPPGKGRPPVSRRVRQQAAQEGSSPDTTPTPAERTELEAELAELANQAAQLTPAHYSALLPRERVALAYLDETIRDGSAGIAAFLQNLKVLLDGLRTDDIQALNKELKQEGLVEFVEEDGLIRPVPTKGGTHFIKNVIRDALEVEEG